MITPEQQANHDFVMNYQREDIEYFKVIMGLPPSRKEIKRNKRIFIHERINEFLSGKDLVYRSDVINFLYPFAFKNLAILQRRVTMLMFAHEDWRIRRKSRRDVCYERVS